MKKIVYNYLDKYYGVVNLDNIHQLVSKKNGKEIYPDNLAPSISGMFNITPDDFSSIIEQWIRDKIVDM